MSEFLHFLESNEAVPIVFLCLAFVMGMTVWLTLHWRWHRRMELEAALKQEMIQRGMSATEIERVLAARLGEAASYEAPSHAV
jgi:hypothetical protein